MKFRFAMRKSLFILLFNGGGMKWNLVLGVVRQKWLIKNVNKPERQNNIETGMLEATIKAFIEAVLS